MLTTQKIADRIHATKRLCNLALDVQETYVSFDTSPRVSWVLIPHATMVDVIRVEGGEREAGLHILSDLPRIIAENM